MSEGLIPLPLLNCKKLRKLLLPLAHLPPPLRRRSQGVSIVKEAACPMELNDADVEG